MRAEILSIGTELLLGQIADTNAAYLAQQLATLGIDLFFVSQVGDNLDRLAETLRRARDRSDLVICTGGLGPTEDDLTREAIARVLDEQPVVNGALEAELRAFFAGRGVVMPERNVKQAWVIPSVTVLPNPVGTAPGWWAERDGKLVVAMPGVPHEMHRMWEHEVVPRLRPRTGAIIFTRTLRVAGLGESTVEERLDPILHGTNPTVATYAKRDAVDVRLTAKAASNDQAQALVDEVERQARELLGLHVFGVDTDTPQSVLLGLLRERQLTLGTMESCTGGLLSSLITDVPGSSLTFLGGLVSYAPTLKAEWGVPLSLLETSGTVSREAAEAMARAARQQLQADVGIAVTGVAGPDPLEDKPVGTVHLAVATPAHARHSEQHFRGARTEIKWRAAVAALHLARLALLQGG
jgi:nicotinamide-nucleotide amidase